MGRKDISKVYDRMKPDQEEKREMYRKIRQKAEILNEENSREINVVTYKKKSYAVSIAKFAATAACAGVVVFGGIQLIQKNAEQVIPGNTDSSSEITDSDTDITEKNDIILTDSDKQYKAELVELPDLAGATGVYNGNIIYYLPEYSTDFTCFPVNNISENIVFCDSEGVPLEDIFEVVANENYIAVNQNLLSIYIYDRNFNYIGNINSGICRDLFIDYDDTIYYSSEDSIIRCDINGNILNEVSLDEIVSGPVDSEFVWDMYVMRDGRIAFEITGNNPENVPGIYLLGSDFEKLGFFADYDMADFKYEYNGGIVLGPYYEDDDVKYKFADFDAMDFYDFDELSCEGSIFRGCGGYDAFEVENDTVYGCRFDEGIREEIAVYPGIMECDNISFFDAENGIYIGMQKQNSWNNYYSVPVDGGESVKLTKYNNSGYYYYEKITHNGHIKAVSDIDEYTAECTAADINIETGEEKYTQLLVNPAKGLMNDAFFTDNYIGIITSGDDYIYNPEINMYGTCCTIYNNSGEKVYEIRGVDYNFTIEEKDVLGYYSVERNCWVIMNLNTGEEIYMENDIPCDSFIYQGKGNYDFFFRGEDGFYGGVTDGTEFRYSRIVDFGKLEIPEDISSKIINLDRITSEYLYNFYYDDDEHIYAGTKSGCDLLKLTEVK